MNIWLSCKYFCCMLVTSIQGEISSWIAKEAQINGERNPLIYHTFLASQTFKNFSLNSKKHGYYHALKIRFYICGFDESLVL